MFSHWQLIFFLAQCG